MFNNLENITHEEIFNKMMLVLCANDDVIYNQYKLYDSVLEKFNTSHIFIPINFKYKFMIVMRQLMSSNDDIKVWKENNIYYAIYNQDIIIPKETNLIYDTNWLTNEDLTSYIINNEIKNEFNYKDPETGDTIYHTVLGGINYDLIKKIVDNNNTNNYSIKNNNNKTPIECITDIRVAILVISNLNYKIEALESKSEIIENNFKIIENNLETQGSKLEIYNTKLEILEYNFETLQNKLEILETIHKHIKILLFIIIFIIIFILYYNI